MRRIPLTRNALVQHTKRAVLDIVHVRGQAMHPGSEIPHRTHMGWIKRDEGPATEPAGPPFPHEADASLRLCPASVRKNVKGTALAMKLVFRVGTALCLRRGDCASQP